MTEPSPIDARRIIALEGGRNFRDLGGYGTQDGRSVKWRTLFRSGSMAGVTPADEEQLAKLSIRSICDLRTIHEREADPCSWHRASNIDYWSRDYVEGFGELRRLMTSPLSTREDARLAMIEGYRRLPFQQAPGYRELFKRLGAGQVPLVFNCSAGKDRAGTGAALVLSALGVPREIVLEDYVLTDRVVDFKSLFIARAQERKSSLASQSEGIIEAVLGTDTDYLNAAFDAVEEKYGSLESYLEQELAVDSASLSRIRHLLLEQ